MQKNETEKRKLKHIVLFSFIIEEGVNKITFLVFDSNCSLYAGDTYLLRVGELLAMFM
jgi:hypothetical protein